MSSLPVPLPVILLIILVAAGLAWYLSRPAPVPSPTALTPEARAYVRAEKLDLAEVAMQAHESYLKQRVVSITGKITNKGERNLKSVEIYCVFTDPYGQVVLRERVPIVSPRAGGLKPAETKPFRLGFDNIPESWNQVQPQLVIASIDFGS